MVGVYICPRGVFGVECRRKSSGIEILRSFEAHGRIDSAAGAIRQLTQVLSFHGIKGGELAVAVRGLGAAHHVLSFPRAADAVLDAIVTREVRRLEPQLENPAIGWTRLADGDASESDQAAQTDVLTAAFPGPVVTDLEDGIRAAGHTLLHLTTLSSALHRLAEEFLPAGEPGALIAQLPDGPFLGYTVDGAIRLAVEPPVRDEDALPDIEALTDEAELGALFVRQQFRGAQITRAAVIASDDAYADVEAAVGGRLAVPVERIPLPGLSAGAVAAFGALLDARSAHPVGVAGHTVERRSRQAGSKVRSVAVAIGSVAAVTGIWALSQAFAAKASADALHDSRRRIEAESFDFAPARSTADRRRTIRDAVAAVRQAQEERASLQRNLASIANSVPSAITLDSISLEQGPSTWQATMGGTATGPTSAQAVQSLGDFYRRLGSLAPVESLSLNQLSYSDTTGRSLVRFEVRFGVRSGSRD